MLQISQLGSKVKSEKDVSILRLSVNEVIRKLVRLRKYINVKFDYQKTLKRKVLVVRHTRSGDELRELKAKQPLSDTRETIAGANVLDYSMMRFYFTQESAT